MHKPLYLGENMNVYYGESFCPYLHKCSNHVCQYVGEKHIMCW